MSLIASFYTIAATRRREIVDAFRPIEVKRKERRWLIFPRTRSETTYPWFDYLRAHAREEVQFDYSGIALVDFDLILAQSSTSIFQMGLPESNDLSTYSQASVALLDHDRAYTALGSLEALTLTAEDVTRFYDSDSKPPQWRCDPPSVLAAHQQLILWCRSVSPEQLGLLMVG